MHRRVVVYCNPDKPQAKRAFTALSSWLKRRKVSVIPRLNDPLCRQADFAVILGGDGTILAAARALAAETLAVLDHAEFAALFGPSSRAEVPLVGLIGGRVLSGQVDRLLVTDDEVLIVDFKTNRPPPATHEEVAPAYIAQLAAYRVALKGLFPRLSLRAALLWTDGPRLMEIPSTSLDAAEVRLMQRRREP